MFKKIINDLEKIKQEVELMDDPLGDMDKREGIGIAHHQIESCIIAIEAIQQTDSPDQNCASCNGTKMVQIAPHVRGMKVCPACSGR